MRECGLGTQHVYRHHQYTCTAYVVVCRRRMVVSDAATFLWTTVTGLGLLAGNLKKSRARAAAAVSTRH